MEEEDDLRTNLVNLDTMQQQQRCSSVHRLSALIKCFLTADPEFISLDKRTELSVLDRESQLNISIHEIPLKTHWLKTEAFFNMQRFS